MRSSMLSTRISSTNRISQAIPCGCPVAVHCLHAMLILPPFVYGAAGLSLVLPGKTTCVLFLSTRL